MPSSRRSPITLRKLATLVEDDGRCRQLLHFVERHGERRITRAARNWLAALDEQALAAPGTLVLVAHRGKRLLGLLAVSEFGARVMMFVVRRGLRNQGLGRQLILQALHRLGGLEARVATDNPASIAACFSAGLVAVKLERGVTGKPTLVFTGGTIANRSG